MRAMAMSCQCSSLLIRFLFIIASLYKLDVRHGAGAFYESCYFLRRARISSVDLPLAAAASRIFLSFSFREKPVR